MPFTIALIVLFAALVARLGFAAWERYDGSVSYDELVAFGGAYWPMNVLVFGPGFAIGFAVQALLAWQLGRGRGRVIVWAGSGLLLVGGALFALTATAHALPYDWAANHGILDEATGRSVVEAFDGSGTPLLLPYILGAQALIAAGAVVTVIGGRMSRTIPTWLLVITVLLVVAAALAPVEAGSILDAAMSILQAVLWGVLGWFGWRATAR